MSYWQGVRYLIWNEIRKARWRNIFFVIIIAYTALFTYREMEGIILGKEFSSFLIDYLCIMMFAVLGLTIGSVYGFGFKKDLLSERLSYWRSLPIKIDQIVWARLITTTITGFLAVVAYYYLVAIGINLNGHSIDVGAFALHGLTTYAISFVFTAMYLFFELGMIYKKYLLYSWIKPFVLVAIILTYSITWKFSLLEKIYEAVQQAPLVMAGASIVLIIATFLLAFRLINEKVRLRNIL